MYTIEFTILPEHIQKAYKSFYNPVEISIQDSYGIVTHVVTSENFLFLDIQKASYKGKLPEEAKVWLQDWYKHIAYTDSTPEPPSTPMEFTIELKETK